MYLKKSTRKKNNRTHLSIVHNFWDSTTKKSKTKTIQTLGYLDELKKKYDDPIAHFEAVVTQMNEEHKNENSVEIIKINLNEKIDKNNTNRKNFGYVAFSKIYHELEIDKFFLNRQRSLNVSYNLNNVMKLMVFSRLIYPCSKKKTFDNKCFFFENSNFSLVDIYRALSDINKFKDALQLFIYEHIREQYGRNTDIVYYDVTNYYFEVDEEDEFRRNGPSKEHRKDPIVQMGLMMDTLGIPIAYKLFKGNQTDCTTLVPVLKEIRTNFNLGRLIVVADKGLNTAENIYYNTKRKNGYVFSQSVRKANKELKKYVLDENGYEWIGKDYKRKSRLYPREIEVTEDGKKIKVEIHEKQVIFYSRDYDKRAKAERESTLRKAREFIKYPSKYNNAISYGAAKYIKNLKIDKDTGEIVDDKAILEFDEKKLKEEEKFDGYYAIVTSEWKESDDRIIEIYRGLWKIEESFKITKSDLEARPVYVSREDRIQSHFLICFISLVISRILQHRLGNKYCVTKIIESLRNVSCSHAKENLHLFDYRDEVTDAIGEVLGIDFTKKFMKLGEIKKILGEVKKG
ncbi:TPA: IS1634 family transposase [Candidatus Nomurabacteria bacterium]|nr:IS1634 family transposase [Candidatus Nomurabacteria bacterium]